MNYWYIWFEVFEDGRSVGKGRYVTGYKHKSSAERRARQMWGKDVYDPMLEVLIRRRWIVAQTNPWEDDYVNLHKLYEQYKRDWCADRGYILEDIDEEAGINGECYACFNEWYDNEYMEGYR